MHIKHATFFFDVDPETKYIFMVFRVGESFLTQKQSCITQKVGLEKWCLFFDFVCFSGRHFTLPHFAKKDIVKNFFLKFLHFHLTFLHHISKIWGCVLQFWFILILAMCVLSWSLPDIDHIHNTSSSNFPLQHIFSLCQRHNLDYKLIRDGVDFPKKIVPLKNRTGSECLYVTIDSSHILHANKEFTKL